MNTKSNDARRADPIDLSILWSVKDNVIMFDEDMGYRPQQYYDVPPPPEEGPSTKPDQKTAIIDFLSQHPDGKTRREIQIACRIRSEGRTRTVLLENPNLFQKVYGTNPPKYVLVKQGGI